MAGLCSTGCSVQTQKCFVQQFQLSFTFWAVCRLPQRLLVSELLVANVTSTEPEPSVCPLIGAELGDLIGPTPYAQRPKMFPRADSLLQLIEHSLPRIGKVKMCPS